MKELDILHGERIKFDHDAQLVRIKREENVHDDRYEKIQPATMPNINCGFIGTMVDICFGFILDDCDVDIR